MYNMSTQSAAVHSVIFTIGTTSKNTFDDWHMIPSERPVIAPPEVKENYVDIPGADGFLDLTEAISSRPVYGPREGTLDFMIQTAGIQTSWATLYSEIMTFLHGKSGKLVLEDDPGYYYEGRFKVNPWKSEESWSTIAIDYKLSPYKTNSTNNTKTL